jgi:methanogenic corrinoid protein MtbC1
MNTSSSGLLGPVRIAGEAIASDAEPFLEAILAGDQPRALAIAADAQRSGLVHFYEDVVEAALEGVGRLWQEDRISIADEHLATAICELAIASLYPGFAWPVGGPSAIVACVAPERHQLGARMASDLLALEGWCVTFLGEDVPTRAILEAAVARRPMLVGLSASLEHHLPALEAAIRDLRHALPDTRILAGGRAVRSLRDPAGLGADAWACSGSEGVRAAAPWKR